MTKTHRLAIVGTGASVFNHMAAIQALGDRVSVVAAVDIDEARVTRFCAENGIPNAYTSVETMLTSEAPTLVCLITPPATHTALTIQCLEAGAWVFCEKPLCASLAEFDAITQAEIRTGRYVSTVFQWRFGSAVKHLKQLMQANSLGKPLVAVCNTLWYRTQSYYNEIWRASYRDAFGGPTMTLGIHLMDLLLWLMGDWQEVTAFMSTLDRQIEVEDVSTAMVRFENGTLASIVNSALSPRQESYLRLDFQKATVEVSALYRYTNDHWHVTLPAESTDNTPLVEWQNIPQALDGSHEQQFIDLLDAMERGERPLVSGDESRKIIEFTASLYKSAHEKCTVRRGEITPADPYYYGNSGKISPQDLV